MAKILLAAHIEAEPMLHKLLIKDNTVIATGTLIGAEKALQQGVDAVICTIKFDESQMFDLLDFMNEKHFHHLPVFLIKATSDRFRRSNMNDVVNASRLLGKVTFFDFVSDQESKGQEFAQANLTQILNRFLSEIGQSNASCCR